MKHLSILGVLAVGLAAFGCGSAETVQDSTPPVPQWGDPVYSVVPIIKNTPSVVKALKVRDDIAVSKELSEDGSYYRVYVGVDMPDRFDPWFALKVMRDGAVYREVTIPETLVLRLANNV